MEYKLRVVETVTAKTSKEVRLRGVDTILKPSLLDNNYTFLDKNKHIVYSTPALNVISIQLINNKKENENE